jgi:hypothetical protein
MTVTTARRIRQLYDLEAAALSAAAVLLDSWCPDRVAAAQIQMAPEVHTLATAQGNTVAVPEYAQALVRGWAGQPLISKE